mgnify:CR=1 FL=1
MEQKETVCSVAKKCGGCRYQGVSYQEQLRRKQRITEGLLKKFGKVEPIIGMEKTPIITETKFMQLLAVTGRET